MIFILLVLLIVLLFVVAILKNFDFMSPELWVVAGYVVGVAGGALNYKIWGDISGNTVLVIILTIIPFLIGAAFGKLIRTGTKNHGNTIPSEQDTDQHISKLFVIIMNAIMLIVVYFYLMYMYQLSLIGGNRGGWQHMFSYARLALSTDDAVLMGFWLSLSIRVCFGFAYVQTYIVIQDIIYRGRKSVRLLDVTTIVLYLIHALLSGGRTKMLYYVLFIAVVFIVLYRHKNNWNSNSRIAGLKYIILSTIAGLGFFWLIDQTVRGSVYGNTFTMWDQFSKYISSPIYAFDVYLKEPTRMLTFAETETLFPLISVMNKLGANIPFINNALEFVNYGKSVTVITNIYTASRRYIHDFGYFGLLLIMFFQGTIYSTCYESIKVKRIKGLKLLLYGVIVYPAAFYFIEERFLNDLFTLTMIFQIICIVLFWKLSKLRLKTNSSFF